MRRACVAGNWKMNGTVEESLALVKSLIPGAENIQEAEIVICPPFTALAPLASLLAGSPIKLGAQNLYWEKSGAFTGEISPLMVAELAEYVILGHSERRAYFHDLDDDVHKKVAAALSAGLKPILCVGETLPENESGQTGPVVTRQLKAALTGLSAAELGQIMIAYEPVWAIGTGKAATPEGANQVIRDFIRGELARLGSGQLAEEIRVLYGGSVKPGNARDFFQQPEIDGALVGGASLSAEDFLLICAAAA